MIIFSDVRGKERWRGQGLLSDIVFKTRVRVLVTAVGLIGVRKCRELHGIRYEKVALTLNRIADWTNNSVHYMSVIVGI